MANRSQTLPLSARAVVTQVYDDLPEAMQHTRTLNTLFGAVRDLVAQQHPGHPYQRRAAALRDTPRQQAPLTRAQQQILPLMASGHTNTEISRILGVTVDTVKTHARRMYQALGARGREHAVAIAIRSGLLHLDAA